MSTRLPEIRVEIHKLGNEFFVAAKTGDGREICTNRFEHNPTGLTHMGPLWLLERGMLGPAEMSRVGAALVGRASQGQVALYGRRLYDYLFGNGKALRKFLKDNLAEIPLHLRLLIHADASSLWRLPWEYLHDGAEFVCLTGQLQLTRLPEGLPLLTPAAVPLPLRLLVAVAAPTDQEPLDVERELDVVMEALRDGMDAGLMQVKVLNDVTLATLQSMLKQEAPHILHYIGHGQYSSNQKGYLCFQNEQGRTAPVTALHLAPLLSLAAELRLVTLAACQSAPIGVLDAFDNVAAGLLQSGVPAVLTMPTSLHDDSAIALAHTLYTPLTKGADVLDALHQARQEIEAVDAVRPDRQRRFDWGVPALYTRAEILPLVNYALAPAEPTAAVTETARDVGGLIVPSPWVGRSQELQTLQAAVRDALPALYLWGPGGIGKSAAAAALVEQMRGDLDDVLIVRCPEYPAPLAALETLAAFWRARGSEAHHQAAALLLDARQPPAERARQALQLLPAHRALLVFDHFDAWLTPAADAPFGASQDASQPYPLCDAVLEALLTGLIAARAGVTLLFTARRRWTGLDALPATHYRELPLPLLPQAQATLLLNALPALIGVSLEDKQTILRVIGGHPHALRLLDRWLTAGRTLPDLLADPTAPERIAEAWQACFLDDLLAQLDPGAREALNVLAVWNTRFTAADVAQLTPILAQHVPALLHTWEDLALLEVYAAEAPAAETGRRYALPPAVREQALASLSPETLRMAHSQIAAYYGAPFVEEARRQVTDRTFSTWSEERIEWLARSASGVLGMWVRQTHDFGEARQVVNRAVVWQHHLLEAGEAAAGLEVAKAISPILNRWGQTDFAKALLTRAAHAQEGAARALSLTELANLSLETGHLAEALTVYQSIYQTLSETEAQPQRAHTLTRIAHIHQRLGDLPQAIAQYEAALALMREINDDAGAGQCLHPLAALYRKAGEPLQAMPYAQEVKEFYAAQRDLAGLMSITCEQGLIFKALGERQHALEAFHESLETARTIGDDLQVAANLEEMAAVLQELQKWDAAIKMLQEALKIYHLRPDQQRKVIATLEALGALYDQQGRAAEAQAIYERARRLRQALERESVA